MQLEKLPDYLFKISITSGGVQCCLVFQLREINSFPAARVQRSFVALHSAGSAGSLVKPSQPDTLIGLHESRSDSVLYERHIRLPLVNFNDMDLGIVPKQ
ncbi:hypothetical protein LK540_21525 [Massilia sp. IC2-278]|uniref:hypothetical protein n=1 Tax=Massilia sp. IC2-278 TaxID=2887200 RepID=UPI001E2F4C69|nr:hypothetical protein [Massilia sp. IC2-278]MCC2963017.1 hypothetical protein [Massilia sp. IC2-278]